ncbi:MAG: RIP metalloprotease RseP [Patescibacteria group bacterium]|jgi:regulator of sigma E protease
MLLTIIIFILVLSILVFAHELGHFFTARRFGVKAEEFGFGFPPRAIGWYKNYYGKWRKIVGNRSVESLENSEDKNIQPGKRVTIYSLNWLPLGGFVKIKGENGEGQADNDSFINKKIWQRVVILAAGVIMNVILAWFLFSVGYLIGLPQSTDSLGPKAIVSQAQVMVAQVMPNSLAEKAGLKEGDAIISVGGLKVSSEKSLQDAIAASSGQEVNLLVRRNNQETEIKVTPISKAGERATIGIAIFSGATVRYPLINAFWEGAKTTGWMLKEIVVAFVGLFENIFQGHQVGDQFAGPVGIASITGQAARLGFAYLLQFIALLSLNLAVINILPFPALDGGRIVFLLIEKVKGKPVRREVEAFIHNFGFLLLIALVIFITYKDIIKLF